MELVESMGSTMRSDNAEQGINGAQLVGPGCRFCQTPLQHTFVDLGMSPLCESLITEEQLNMMEPFYPLHVFVCSECFLVQLLEYVTPQDIYGEYAYFSSYSDSWLEHARRYVEMITARFNLSAKSQVVELASNDGYLLRNFVARGIPVLGVEPAANVAAVAVQRGIPTTVRFFGVATAQALAAEGKRADLIVGNNVLAHVPDLNDFVGGMKILLKPAGLITMEFPHLSRLVEGNQYDTIYHEHFSYLSFLTVNRIFAAHGMRIFDVEELGTHGGSLRIYACHQAAQDQPTGSRVTELQIREEKEGVNQLDYYQGFGEEVKAIKRNLLEFLLQAKRQGKQIVGYGAPGKGNTLLNYCGIRTDFLDYTVDRNPYKHGKYTAGTHIPIFPPEKIRETKPDYVLILPWNLKEEIVSQLSYIQEWNGKCVVPIPNVEVL
jgi:2-polyprenyl-3-methyl-5-hydroxy-6-metoxy-1,4-benzoquinol methylase